MRIIKEEYWTQFVKMGPDGHSESRDGQRFEDLVLDILKCLYSYKNITWRSTKKTHDGNKDFVGVHNEEIYWAECKNHSSKIDLKTLAATLVMAEIENVNEVLFFCYSDINNNTKKKLFCHSRRTERPVCFYDGIVLDQLILKYKEQLFPKYFPELKTKELFVDEYDRDPVYLSYIERNPFATGSVIFEKSDLNELQNLQLGEIIGINLLIINRNTDKPLCVNYYLKGDDVNNFSVLNCDVSFDGMKVCFKELIVKPGQMKNEIVFLRYDRFSHIVSLPQVYVADNAISPTGSILSLGSRYASFLGRNYVDIVSDVKTQCLYKNRLSLIVFFGSSGTGKSRLLRECSEQFLGHGYKILNFNYSHTVSNKRENLSLYTLLQEIIFTLYGLDDEILELIAENEINRTLITDRSGKIEIIQKIFENRTNLDKIDKAEFVPIFEKMISDQIVFTIDDLQGCDDGIIDFWESFLNYALNLQRKISCVLILAVNTDMLHSVKIKEWMLQLQQLRYNLPYTYYEKEIIGFENIKRATFFLKECLGLDEDIDLLLSDSNISLRPKYLLELANLLVDKKIVQFHEEKPFISDEAELHMCISRLQSASLNNVIRERWSTYCDHNPNSVKEKSKDILCYLLFAEELDASYANLSQEYKNVLNNLWEHGFIKCTLGCHIYKFEHDAIKNFFLSFYTDWLERSMEVIMRDDIRIDNNSLEFLCDICSFQAISEDDINRYLTLEFSEHLQNKADEKIIIYLLGDKFCGSNLYFILKDILTRAREHSGEKYVERLYHIIDKRYTKDSNKMSDDEYCNILQDYAENQLKLKNTDNSILLYKRILKINDDELIKCVLYNRWFVCGRIGEKIHKYNNYWEYSFSLAEQNNYYDLYIENLFDKAQSYFLDNKKKDYVLELLYRGCEVYEKHLPKNLAGHYLYRKIQIDFIKGDFSQLKSKISNANIELLRNPLIESKLFFKIQFTIFEIMYGLIYDQNIDILSLLNELNMQQRMQNQKQMYHCYYLYAKYYLSQKMWDKGLSMYKKTFENLSENTDSEEICLQHEFILEDMIYNMYKYKFPTNEYDLSFFSNFPNWDKEFVRIHLNDFESYNTMAIVVGNDNKDGYLLF